MTHIFNGPPDQRQSAVVDRAVSRFRPTYPALTDEEKQLHNEIKIKAAELEQLYAGLVPNASGARYHALAMTALEESVMWAVKQLTS